MSDQIIDISLRHCTKSSPMPHLSQEQIDQLKAGGISWRWVHDDAEEIGDHSDEGYEAYKCPNCGKYFEVELPQ